MPIRTSIPYLPALDPLAIAPRKMPNAPVTTPHPSFQTPKTALPTLYFVRNSDTRFAPKFATSNDGFCVDHPTFGVKNNTREYLRSDAVARLRRFHQKEQRISRINELI